MPTRAGYSSRLELRRTLHVGRRRGVSQTGSNICNSNAWDTGADTTVQTANSPRRLQSRFSEDKSR